MTTADKRIIKSALPDDAGYYMAQINTDPMKIQVCTLPLVWFVAQVLFALLYAWWLTNCSQRCTYSIHKTNIYYIFNTNQQMAYLSVMEPPNIDDEATPSVRQIRENESVDLHCQASGQPMPNITWKREDGTNISHGLIFAHNSDWNRHFSATSQLLNDVHADSCRHLNDNNIQQQQKDLPLTGSFPKGYGRFCIASTRRSSMGTYLCIASNGVLPAVSKRIQLVVLCELTSTKQPTVLFPYTYIYIVIDHIAFSWIHQY
jgi:hypothetical protein